MRILFFAPHPDDLEFFAGGLVVDHIRRGDEVFEVVVSHGERRPVADSQKRRRRHEALVAAQLIGVQHVLFGNFPAHNVPFDQTFRATVRSILRRVRPDTVYIPSPRHRLDFWIRDHWRLGATLLPLLKGWGVTDIRLHGTIRPTVLVDVSRSVQLVQRALRVHRSQWYLLRFYSLLRRLFLWRWGRRLKVRYAEGFSWAT